MNCAVGSYIYLCRLFYPMPSVHQTLYFENSAGQVYAHSQGYAILRYSAGRRAAGSFEALGTALAKLLTLRQWPRFLSDQRLLTPLSEAEKRWTTANWMGNSVGRPASLREAIVLSTDVFTRLGVTEILNQTTALAAGLVIHYFTEEAPALAFLLA